MTRLLTLLLVGALAVPAFAGPAFYHGILIDVDMVENTMTVRCEDREDRTFDLTPQDAQFFGGHLGENVTVDDHLDDGDLTNPVTDDAWLG